MGVLTPFGKHVEQHRARPFPARLESGSVLLEVVLALALFVAAATIISGGVNSAVESANRIRLKNHAANLAITVLSEMQMQARPIAESGPEPFDPPFEDWTYKIEVTQNTGSIDASESLTPVEVIIRHSQENIVQRLTQLFRASDISSEDTNAPAENFPGVVP